MEDLGRRFERFARLECHGSSPLYERFSLGISADPVGYSDIQHLCLYHHKLPHHRFHRRGVLPAFGVAEIRAGKEDMVSYG